MRDAFYFGPDRQKIGVIAGQPGMPSYTAFYCKECGERAMYRHGTVYAPHFAHHQANEDCYLSSSNFSDYYAGTGRHFRGEVEPIREHFNAPLGEPIGGSERSAQLKLWMTVPSVLGAGVATQFHLELPWLAQGIPYLDRLHDLGLQVPAALKPMEPQSWRLWPGQMDNRVSVHLKLEYTLDLDPNWPRERGWRREGLNSAKLRLSDEGNVFLIPEDGGDSGCLLSNPIELAPGSQLFFLAQSKEQPPDGLQPEWIGLVKDEGEWHLWRMAIPAELDLTEEDQAWLDKREWVIRSPRVVRIISPPPLGFEAGLPMYPDSKGGWVLMRDPQEEDGGEPSELWAMEDPLLGRQYSLDEGHAPKAAKCQPSPPTWSEVPFPSLILKTQDGGDHALNLVSGSLVIPQSIVMADDLQVFVRSLFPLEVLAGPPGRTVKIHWRPDRPLDRVGPELAKAARSGKRYELILLGAGLAKQVISVEGLAQKPPSHQTTGYHQKVREMAGWPAYLLTSKVIGD